MASPAGAADPDLALSKTFAKQQRLRLTRDECGDPIFQGRKGHLYFAAGELCAIWTDAKPIKPARLQALNPRWSWQGDVSGWGTGARVQDAWVKGIPLEFSAAAIRLAGCKLKRIPTQENLDRLARMRARIAKPHGPERRQPLERVAGPVVGPNAGDRCGLRFVKQMTS
jgi:hypothetical protein